MSSLTSIKYQSKFISIIGYCLVREDFHSSAVHFVRRGTKLAPHYSFTCSPYATCLSHSFVHIFSGVTKDEGHFTVTFRFQSDMETIPHMPQARNRKRINWYDAVNLIMKASLACSIRFSQLKWEEKGEEGRH